MDTIVRNGDATSMQPVFRRRFKRQRSHGEKAMNKRQKREMNAILNRRSELKFYVTNQGGVNITSTWAVAKAALISQGTADEDRTGDRITWCGNIEMIINVINATGVNSDLYNNCRFILFQWHPNDSTAPTASNILLNGVTGSVDTSSHYSHDNRQLFTILWDRTFKTVGNFQGAGTPGTSDSQSGIVHFTIPMMRAKKQVQFLSGSTAGTNQLYLLYASDSSAAAHPQAYWGIKGFYRNI